jgi:Tol biopolymer transport system component
VGATTEIYVMNSDGTGTPTQLTDTAGQDTVPSFSPDGEKIVFESFRDGNSEIYRMNADGSSQKRLTKNPGRETLPDWGVASQ